MTGREGRPFPAFFMAEAGQPDTDVRGGPLVAGRRRWPGNAVIGSSPPSMAGRGSCQGGRRRFRGAVLEDVRKDRWMHCEGPIPALPVAGFFGGTACCLKKMQTFFCVFSAC